MPNSIDLKDKLFGNLKVIERCDNSKNGKAVWKCLCKCGRYKNIISGNLVQNKSLSCGVCVKTKNLLGKTFGKVKVIDSIGLIKTKFFDKNVYVWLCEDENGIKKTFTTAQLNSGRGIKKPVKLNNEDSAVLNLMRKYKHGAKKRNHSFNLLFLEFKSFIFKNCYYCGSKPNYTISSRNGKNYNILYNGIDRKDNNKGYEIDNCITCCKICNRSKSNLDYNVWINYLNQLSKYWSEFVR